MPRRGIPSERKRAEIRFIIGIVDSMPAQLRQLVHEFDYNPVVQLMNQGVEDPVSIYLTLMKERRRNQEKYSEDATPRGARSARP